MEAIEIRGGISLQGQVRIQGSKNAVLPVLAATLLTEGKNVIGNCPRLTDVFHMQMLLESLGCRVSRDEGRMKIDASNVDVLHALGCMPADAAKSMRSSVILLGALIGRTGEVYLEYPGGCVIGERPIGMHMEALKKLGVAFEEDDRKIRAHVKELHGAEVELPFPSVGATENLILAAVRADGKTVIRNAAREPEIETLCDYLTSCGADISGAGSGVLTVRGTDVLHGTEFSIPGDRIVAGTYLCACMAAGGEVLLKEAPERQMDATIACAERMGAVIQRDPDGLYVCVRDRLTAPDVLTTGPYPAFPTDMQSPFLTVLSVSEGECLVRETVFENRFHTVPCLKSMGADVCQLDRQSVRVRGVGILRGCIVNAKELRGGAALVIAGIAAKGRTVVEGCRYIDRGYENICRDLRELGARIRVI